MIACPRCGHPNDADARYCSNCALALGAATAAAEARKTVTVLFMDAVGSTGIGESADPETLRRVMTRYFDEIRSIVERHGGVVEKYIGDAMMAVFGVPVVHEDDALRAVRAATDIRERLADVEVELQRSRGLAIQWRTGINTGEVVAGDAGAGQRFVTGDAVNIAARLEQAAAAGEILLGGETRRLLRDAVTVEPVAAINAKGKSEPLEAYRLVAVEPTAAGPSRRLEAPMVGRQRPSRLLADAFDHAVSERVCHLFTILGAAGVGKSRLVREFLTGLGDGALVLRGRCLSYGEGITYWPIAEMVRQAAAIADEDPEDEVLAKIGRLIGSAGDGPKAALRLGELIGRSEAGAAGQEETFWAVRTLFESLARERPLVLVLDDLHWAESTLLDLVEHLAEWITDAPLLLVCICRQELLEARPNWGGGKAYATTLTLEPLNEGESRELVSGLLGSVDLGRDFDHGIAAGAEGNPLFVEELIAMLIDSGRLVAHDNRWSVEGGLRQIDMPPTIHAVLSARLDGLPAAERMVLERASIEGKSFHRGAVVELAPDVMRDTVPTQLRSLARKELVRPDRPDFASDEAFRFRHLLIRDAAYGALPKEIRADLHARFAGWLSRMAADHVAEYDEILGYHYQQAVGYRSELGLADEETANLRRAAVDHLAAAGERALDRNDIAAARKLLATATELLPADDRLGRRVRVQLADTLAKSGELNLADEMLAAIIDDAATTGDVLGQAHAEVVRLSLAASHIVPIEQVITDCERLRRTFAKHGDRRGEERATYELARHQFFAGHAKLAEDTLDALARTGSPAAAAQASTWLPVVLLWGPANVAAATARLTELLRTAPNRTVEATSLASLGVLRAYGGAPDEGRDHCHRAIAIVEELGLQVMTLTYAGNFLAAVERLAGNDDEAERIMVGAYGSLFAAGERGYAATMAGHVANLYMDRGRLDEAERYARLGQELAPSDDIDAQARGLKAQARILAARGQLAAALQLARQAKTIVDATDYLSLRAETYADLAEVLLAAGNLREARAALETARSHFEAKGITVEAQRVAGRLAELA